MGEKTLKVRGVSEILTGAAAGAISFPAALGVIQTCLFKPLRISCKIPAVAMSIFGGSSVVLSGALASSAFVASCVAVQKLRPSPTAELMNVKLDIVMTSDHILLYGVGTLVVFKCFGGRARYVMPSHLCHPGAFARIAIRATGKNYASSSLKKTINVLGKKYGCHSCGKKHLKDFVADHMPPNKLVKFYQSQKFYPQCKSCSHRQGGALSGNSRVSAIQTHATTLRRYHIWLPIPIGIALIKDILESQGLEAD